MKGQQGCHLRRLLRAGLSGSWALPVLLGTMAVVERSWPSSPPVEQSTVRAMSFLPVALLRAMWTPFSAAWRSLFITIFLPPHLFDITYSVWKYCPFCPLLHHLLTQSRVCVWVRSSWHTQEVNAFTSPEIADSGRGGGGGGDGDSKDPHPDSAAAEKPIIALSDSARRYQCTAILSPPPALPTPPTWLL